MVRNGYDDGTLTDTLADLSNYIDRDEDFSPGEQDSIAPWMRVTAALPADINIDVQYIYYETSEYEEIVGGQERSLITD